MGFFALRKGVVSPFEEIVLISIREIGHGATFMQVFDKARQLGRGLGHISFYRLELALSLFHTRNHGDIQAIATAA